MAADCKVVGIISNKELVTEFSSAGHETPIGVALNQTPFYAESGGPGSATSGLLLAEGPSLSSQIHRRTETSGFTSAI